MTIARKMLVLAVVAASLVAPAGATSARSIEVKTTTIRTVDDLMACIRHYRSGDNYRFFLARGIGASTRVWSGAYAIQNSTWNAYASRAGVPNVPAGKHVRNMVKWHQDTWARWILTKGNLNDVIIAFDDDASYCVNFH